MSDQIKQLKAQIQQLRDSANFEEECEHAFRMQNNDKYAQEALDKRNVLLTEIEIKEEQLTALEEAQSA